MNCEKCGSRSKVLDTRNDGDPQARNELGTVYRRRECLKCKTRWGTAEIREDRLHDYDFQTRAEKAEAKLKTAKQALHALFGQL